MTPRVKTGKNTTTVIYPDGSSIRFPGRIKPHAARANAHFLRTNARVATD